MDDKRPQDELAKLIDAVRPASDDLAQPDFARLAERSRRDAQVRAVLQRSQRLDLAIGDAMQDLPVPAGAVERLLATLAAAVASPGPEAAISAADAVSPQAGDVSVDAPDEVETPDFASCQSAVEERRAAHAAPIENDAPIESDTPSRRRSRFLPGAIAAAFVVALVAWRVFQPTAGKFGPDEILNSDWLLNVDEGALAQTLVEEREPPTRYPIAQAVGVPATAWRRVSGFLGRAGVAYQLRSATARATLYVIDAGAAHDAPQVADLDAVPSARPQTTGGKAMSVWREGKLIYVLVVRGGEPEYKSFVTRGGQLARIDTSSASNRVAVSGY